MFGGGQGLSVCLRDNSSALGVKITTVQFKTEDSNSIE